MIYIDATAFKTDCFCVTMLFAKKTKQSAKSNCYGNNAKEESKTKKLLPAAEK